MSPVTQEHALQLADFRHMELTLEDHQIPREMWSEYGIPALLQQKKKKMKKRFQDISEIDPHEGEVFDSPPHQEEDVEQDISVITGADFKENLGVLEGNNQTITSPSESGKVYWKGMEFIEEHDEFKDKELVVLKANSGSFCS
jgi:hypothetical protein